MDCLLCLTSGLIKKNHHRPCFHKTHWSAIVENVMGEIHHKNSPNKTPIGAQQEPLVFTDCLRTPQEDTLQYKCVQKRMVVDSHCRVIKKKDKWARNLKICCAWNDFLWLRKKYACGSNPFPLNPGSCQERTLKLTVEPPRFGLSKHIALCDVVWK